MAALQHEVGQLLPALDGGLVGGDGDELLDPVHILDVAQRGHVVYVIRVVVIGKKAAAAVKALHQHTLPVHVGKAQRAVDGGAAQLSGPVLHHAKQGGGYLRVVDKIHLGEAETVRSPLVVGLTGVDRADAAHDLTVSFRQPAAGVAVIKGRVLAPVPVGQVIVIGGGDELGNVLI